MEKQTQEQVRISSHSYPYRTILYDIQYNPIYYHISRVQRTKRHGSQFVQGISRGRVAANASGKGRSSRRNANPFQLIGGTRRGVPGHGLAGIEMRRIVALQEGLEGELKGGRVGVAAGPIESPQQVAFGLLGGGSGTSTGSGSSGWH